MLSYMNCNNPAEEDFNYLNIFPEEQRKYLKPWTYWCTECSNEAVLGLMDYSDVWKYQELVGEDGISKTNYSLKLPQDLINSRSYFWLDNTEERVVAQTKVYSTVLSYDYYNPEGTCAVCAVNGWKRYGLSLDYRYDINDKSLGIVPKLYISLDLTSNPYFDDVNNLRIQ